MRAVARLRRLPATLALAAAGLAACVVLGYRAGDARALAAQSALAAQQLDLHAQALDQRIERYRALPQLLALDPDLRASVAAPPDAATRQRLNLRLERANQPARASTLTLIDARGVAIAASNWRLPGSNVGADYAFRPYFQQAMREGRGRFYGIGVTTGVPGYYLSEALRDARGRAVGVLVIKLELAAVERAWPRARDVVLASDARGVVFLASRPAWRYRLLAPLDAAARAQLAATRQYRGQPLAPYAGRVLQRTGDGAALVRIDAPAMPGTWLWRRTPVAGTDWTLHLLHDAAPVAAAARQWAAVAGASWVALAALLLFAQQRLRLAALRRRSRAELETLVAHHAEELRSAQDGVVAAAQQADTGLSRRLAHLPQGVVIVNAGLRIVAWNARYIELFRFPPELVQVGTPIEDVFRHNARRGLLGPGPVEDAIERRLGHLRSGRPHMRESEKDDGTVLEIRGNPLPEGGFVTSYADITSYKATARELRSLADALERRIADRTADLEQARRQAEDANRDKTRFVAAAVHDLLQPLNAARLFLSALRTRLHTDEQRQAADHADAALAAQDAVLASLLDLARLESRTYQVQVRDLPLQPLLDALAREFGILARARGLALHGVPTSAVVRSDAALLRRILQNLLSNAVRYARRGRIVLGCRRVGDAVRIEVHDQGPGIAPDLQREIFEEFRRLDDGGDGDRGAGLGLAIVDRIGRLLGHPVGLRSWPGRGSVFWVQVPLGDAAAAHAHVAAQAAADGPAPAHDAPAADAQADDPLRGCVAWCIDDDPRGCEATRAVLLRWGCVVGFAGGPREALVAAGPEHVPQVVLLDVRMGAFDGRTLYEQLRARWRAAPPVILVTAEHADAVRAHANAYGWEMLAKPVRPPALRALMSQVLLRRR